MPQTKRRKQSHKRNNNEGMNVSLRTTWIIIGVATAIFLVGLGLVARWYVNEHSERIRFFTVNTLSWLVLVVVITQAVIYKRQWEAMKETLKEMRTSRELENRAWIGVKSLDFATSKFGGTDILAVFVNSGNTPAIVRFIFVGEAREGSPIDDTELPPVATKGSALALFPHVEVTSRIYTLAAGDAPAVVQPSNPDHAWYMYGSIEYDDVFGHPHTTKFCYRTAVATINGKQIAVFRLAPTHNTFD